MPGKTPFRFLSVAEFGQLSRTEKLAYLALATQELLALEDTLDTQRADFEVEHKSSRKH
jgi:hypothetical protein